MLHNRRRKGASANLEVEFTLRYRNGEIRAPLNESGNLIDKSAVKFIHRHIRKPIDIRRRKLREQFLDIAMGIDGRASGKFQAAMQPVCEPKAELLSAAVPGAWVSEALLWPPDAFGLASFISFFNCFRLLDLKHFFIVNLPVIL